MTHKETTGTSSSRTVGNAGDRNAERSPFEIPECCRQMMTGACCGPPESGAEGTAHNGSNAPGILGRLMGQMMKVCCGRFASRHKVAI